MKIKYDSVSLAAVRLLKKWEREQEKKLQAQRKLVGRSVKKSIHLLHKKAS